MRRGTLVGLISRELHLAALANVFLLALAGSGKAQNAASGPDSFYQQREATASPAVRQALAALRQRQGPEGWTFTVGYTGVADRPLADLAGTLEPQLPLPNGQPPPAGTDARLARRVQTRARGAVTFTAAASSLDWRHLHAVTRIRDQGFCGSCWAFGAVGAFESSFLIVNQWEPDGSEQYVLDCSGGGDCDGGSVEDALQFLVDTGCVGEVDLNYVAQSQPCTNTDPIRYRAAGWDFVGGTQPSVAQIKAALVKYGPVCVNVRATAAMQWYTGGVFNEHDSGPTNHAVVIIGWDEARSAWIVKNSWGNWWGEAAGYGTERGYMWIAYDSNSIGKYARYIVAAEAETPPAVEAYRALPARRVGADARLGSISFDLEEAMFVHMTAEGSLSLRYPSRGKSIIFGLSESATPLESELIPSTVRRLRVDRRGETTPISTSWGAKLDAGEHRLYWHLLLEDSRGAALDVSEGTLHIEGFSRSVGGDLMAPP
jgi:cathepsin L